MKKMFMVAIMTLASALCGQTAQGPLMTNNRKNLGRRISPEMKAKLMERTGGMVVVRVDGPKFVFINAQKRIPSAELKMTHATIERVLNLPVILAEGEVKNALVEASEFIDDKVAACVVITDDPKLPTLLVAPESKWAVVNVASLVADKPSVERLASRLRKEMWRAFAYTMGAAHSTLEGCLMQGINNLSDIDAISSETICPEPFQKIGSYAEKLGIKHNRRGTYRKACVEGWAPAPQTDMQRRIAEEVNKKKHDFGESKE